METQEEQGRGGDRLVEQSAAKAEIEKSAQIKESVELMYQSLQEAEIRLPRSRGE